MTQSDSVPIQSPFGTGRTAVCGDFLPDIFGPTSGSCNCVGRCSDPSKPGNKKDKIRDDFTVEGLVACQNACKKEPECNFYTHAKVIDRKAIGIQVSVCSLWKTCKNFNVHGESVLGALIKDEEGDGEGEGETVLAVSRLWTGAKDCNGFSRCPLLNEVRMGSR